MIDGLIGRERELRIYKPFFWDLISASSFSFLYFCCLLGLEGYWFCRVVERNSGGIVGCYYLLYFDSLSAHGGNFMINTHAMELPWSIMWTYSLHGELKGSI